MREADGVQHGTQRRGGEAVSAFNEAWVFLKGNNKQNQNQRNQWWKKQQQIEAQRIEDNEAQRLARLEEQRRKDEELAARYEAEALAAAQAAMEGQ